MFVYPFEKLQAWHVAQSLVVKLYTVTSKFPSEERYGLVQQIRRAAVSISSNLSEGSGRFSVKDQGHFYSMSYSSLLEVLNQLFIAKQLSWLSPEDYTELRGQIEQLSAIITALRRAVMNKQPKDKTNKL